MMVLLAALFTLVAGAAVPPPPVPNPNFIVLIDQLDEVYDDDYYCADIAGDVVDVGRPLQAHSCKEPNNDELFETNAPFEGMIYISDHNKCLEATAMAEGAYVIVADCDSASKGQQWISTSLGQITPQGDTTLCWTVGADPGIPSGAGGDHMNKTLTLELCSKVETKYTAFHMGRGFVGPPPPP
jgi:hypothetical protein